MEKILEKIKREVDPVIDIILLNNVSLKFRKIVDYQISTGGKRLRPALAVLSCYLLKGKLKDVLYPASGLEVFHNYTLIVDDIIDNGVSRRGKSTTWAKYGKSIANIIAMDYGVAVFEAALHSPCPEKITEIYIETMKKLTEGQFLDLLFERQGREQEKYITKNRFKKISTRKYLEMVSKKTASLMASSCEIGAVCAKAKQAHVKAVKEFGFNLGISFQIQDDVLDIFGKEKSFGKIIGGDIKERKGGNIVLLYALKELKKKEEKRIEAIMKKEKITEKEVREVIKLIKATKALEKADKLKKNYFEKAKKNLKALPKNKWNKHLEKLAQFVIEREK